MQRSLRLILVLFALFFAAGSELHAQSIKVSPTYPYVAVNKTVQFSAQVTGLSSSDVTWSAGGVKGGNSTAGTISSTGLCTAPAALPGQNPVTVTATSTINGKISGSTYVYILSTGPAITAVSPNPLAVGTITVTITGTGFLPSATAFDT